MRASEQTGVGARRSSVGWGLVFAVLAALAVQLLVLTASASADDLWPVEAAQDEAVAVPVAGDDGSSSESPPAAPVLEPEVTSPEPAAPSGPPVESPGPEAADPSLPPSSEPDSLEVTHAGDLTGPAESSPATSHQIGRPTPAVPDHVAPLPAAAGPPLTPVLSPVSPTSPARLSGAALKRSREGMGVATVTWGQPASLVSGVTVHVWGAVVKWRPPPVSLPADPGAKSPAADTTKNPVGRTPPGHPPRVPPAPSSSMCRGASSCGSAFHAMLPLFMGIVCLCAVLFERLFEAPALWRPTRYVSLRERPG